MNNKFHLTVLSILIIGVHTGHTQQLETQNVIVQREYKPTIAEANKINDSPVIKDTVPPVPKLSYYPIDKKVETTFEVEPIEAAKLKGEPLNKLYKHDLKAGAGTYTTPFVEYYFNTERSKKYSLGARANHFSSRGDFTKVGFAGFSDNDLETFGKYFTDKYLVNGRAGYSRNVAYYYGKDNFVTDSIPDKNDIRQRFSTFSAKVGLESNDKDSSLLRHSSNISWYNIVDLYGVAENNIKVYSNLRKKKELDDFGAKLSVDNYNTATATYRINHTIFTVNPYVSVRKEKIGATVGLNLTLTNDSVTTYHLYPDITFQYNLVPEVLTLYGGATGRNYRNSFKYITDINPFIHPDIFTKNTSNALNLFAGARGGVSREINYSISGSYSVNRDYALFVNTPEFITQNKFKIVYDKLNIANVHGELSYSKNEKLSIIAKGDYFNYKTSTELKPWHLPELQLTLTGRYSIAEKLIVNADVFFIGKRYARVQSFGETVSVINTEIRTLVPLADYNLGVEYRYTRSLGGFINFNNLAANRYYRWNNYRTQRFNLLAGIKFTF